MQVSVEGLQYLGVLVPIVTAIVVKARASSGLKALVTLLLSGALGLGQTALDNGGLISREALVAAGTTWAIAILTYVGFLKPTEIAGGPGGLVNIVTQDFGVGKPLSSKYIGTKTPDGTALHRAAAWLVDEIAFRATFWPWLPDPVARYLWKLATRLELAFVTDPRTGTIDRKVAGLTQYLTEAPWSIDTKIPFTVGYPGDVAEGPLHADANPALPDELRLDPPTSKPADPKLAPWHPSRGTPPATV